METGLRGEGLLVKNDRLADVLVLRHTRLIKDLVRIIREYGVLHYRVINNLFTFDDRHRSYAEYKYADLAYLEWLVSITIKLQKEFPDIHYHTYDPVIDTVALVETRILVTMQRLESNMQVFDRRSIFYGFEYFRSHMHPLIAKYAETVQCGMWSSPLQNRYRADDNDFGGNVLSKLGEYLWQSEGKTTSMWQYCTVQDWNIPELAQHILLALLNRRQYIYGEILNIYCTSLPHFVQSALKHPHIFRPPLDPTLFSYFQLQSEE